MKKLENEYRQLMQNETPDLWSRIEAGIDAKIATSNVINSNTDLEMTESEEIEKVVEFAEKKPVNKRNTGANLWKKYSLPLVACIAAIICVPLLLTGFIRMASGGKAESEAMITELAADTAAADCAAPEETMSVTTDCADEPAATIVTEEACDEEMDDAAAEMESAPAENVESMLDGAEMESTSEANKQSAESYAGSLPVLTVTQISQGIEGDDEHRENGVIYHLTTEEAGECSLFVPADAEFTVDMNVQLKIRVKVSDEDYDYVFVEMAE